MAVSAGGLFQTISGNQNLWDIIANRNMRLAGMNVRRLVKDKT